MLALGGFALAVGLLVAVLPRTDEDARDRQFLPGALITSPRSPPS
jgi:hypothetical protein